MKKLILPALSIAILTACGGAKSEEAANPVDSTAVVKTDSAATPAPDKPNPFKDYPSGPTTAKAGEFILIPSYNWLMDGTTKGNDQTTYIYYSAKMGEPGDGNSKVDYTFDGSKEVPNYMIVPLAGGATAKKGDILLTWWQSGSGMMRAIVTNDKNPSEPEVNYIDLDWNNPAKTSEGVGYGQMKEKIKPNTFVKLGKLWDIGSGVAVKDASGSYKNWIITNIQGDKVLCIGFAGRMAMFNKADCTPMEIIPNVKAGDKVQAPWVGTIKNCTVKSVNKEYGRVVVNFEGMPDDYFIPYGDVTKGLEIK
ncbi:MAG TPA: hypothetical protein VGF30_01695 [Bacteroidia bacterium]